VFASSPVRSLDSLAVPLLFLLYSQDDDSVVSAVTDARVHIADFSFIEYGLIDAWGEYSLASSLERPLNTVAGHSV